MKATLISLLLIVGLSSFNDELYESPQHCFDAAINMYDAVISAGFDKGLASKEADIVYDTCMMHLVYN